MRDDLEFLVANGMRDGEVLARRLGFSSAETLERYLYRHSLPVLYKVPRSEILNKPKVRVSYNSGRSDARLYEGEALSVPEDQLAKARRVALRQLKDDNPDSVRDVLAMLGLQSEQQLVSS